MRYLVWFTLGFGTASALGTYGFRGWALVLLGLLAGTAACLLTFRRKNRRLLPAVLVLAGISLGSIWFACYDAVLLSPARQADGYSANLSLTAAGIPEETDYGVSVPGTVLLSGRSYRIVLYLDENPGISPGDRVEVTAKLRFTDLGGEKEPSYLRGNGILLTASAKGEVTVEAGNTGIRELPGILRQRLKDILADAFPADTRGFAAALLLGDKTGMSDQTELDFRLSGLSHIVAVSGLHMSILFALVCIFTGKHRIWTAVIGFPVIYLFAAVAGFTPSVTRAAIMECLLLTAWLFDREYDPPTALAFAGLVMLIRNPLVISSVGFQLSFASVAGIFLFCGRLYRWMGAFFRLNGKSFRDKLCRVLTGAVAVSLSATVMTTPLLAYYFGTVSLVTLIANVLVVPMIGLVFYGVALVCAVGWFAPQWAAGIAGGVSWLIRYVLGMAGLLADVPLAAVYIRSFYILLWLVLCYGLIGWILVRRPQKVGRILLCGGLGLVLALGLSWAEPMLDSYRVTVLDVGQGQCVLLQSRRNVFVVDCGGASDRIAGDRAAEELLRMGISRIDGLIITHYDRDHAGGIPQLALRIQADRLYLPRADEENELLTDALAAMPDAERIWLDGDVQIRFGDCQIRIFEPENRKSNNESCAAVLFQNGKYDTLIISDRTAAQERKMLESGILPDLEILVVGHHGSVTSTCPELLYRTKPEIAMISVGRNNGYGHPAPAVLWRLEQYGCQVWRTDIMGDLVFRG